MQPRAFAYIWTYFCIASHMLNNRVFASYCVAAFCTVICDAQDNSRYKSPQEAISLASEPLVTLSDRLAEMPNFVNRELQVFVDPQFSVEQKNVLREAATVLCSRNIRDIFNSAYAISKKDKPKPVSKKDQPQMDELKRAFLSRTDEFMCLKGQKFFFPFHKRGSFSKLHISYLKGRSDAVGLGWLGTVKPIWNGAAHNEFSIAINTDFLCNDEYFLSKDADYWAGVIAHEMLHNLGFEHPTGYDGNFMTEFGNMVWKNGKTVEIERTAGEAGKKLIPLNY
jgi:hypothetical protein